jgi:hypothetical protein
MNYHNLSVNQKPSHEKYVEMGKKAYATRLRNKAERDRLNGEIQEIRTEIKKEERKVIVKNIPAKKCTVIEAAEFILLKKKKPMHYANIYKKSLKSKLIKPTIKLESVFSTINTDVHGDNPRFKQFGKGVFGLLKWDKEVPKKSIAAHKANDTKRMNAIIAGKNIPPVKKDLPIWDGARKENSRNIIARLFSIFGPGLTLLLESNEMKFVNKLPEHPFIIFEHNPDVFSLMHKKIAHDKIQNVAGLFHNDISDAVDLNVGNLYRYAFLDFCDTFENNIERLRLLEPILHDCRFIAFTFCMRYNKRKLQKRDMERFSWYVIPELQYMFKNHSVIHVDTYRDTNGMCTLVFINREIMKILEIKKMSDLW